MISVQSLILMTNGEENKMAVRRIKNESFENMRSVVKDANKLDTHVNIDPVTADAVIQHEAVEVELDSMQKELSKKAEGLVPEAEEPKNVVENGYTASLKLDENFSNFVLKEEYFDTQEYRVTRYQDDIAECIEYIQDKLGELENKYNEGKMTAKVYADKLAKIYDILTENSLHRLWTEELELDECNISLDECNKDFFLNKSHDAINEADGRSNRVTEEDDKDKHLDFDMADFLMCLVADADDMNPKSPLGRNFKKFNTVMDAENENISGRYNLLITGDIVGKILVDLVKGVVKRLPYEDSSEVVYKIRKQEGGTIYLYDGAKLICDSTDSEAPATQFVEKSITYDIRKVSSLNRVPQTGATDTEVTVYGDYESRFNDIIAICNEYKLSYKGPTASKNTDSYWKYYLDIEIPVDESGLPMLVEDYFATVYPEEADTVMYKVMPNAFAKAYYNKKEKMNKEQAGVSNDIAVRKALKAAITAASWSDEPLEVFLDKLYKDLEGYTYDKAAITKEFNDAFVDDFDDEDDE